MTELARPFSISLNSVSKHIRILERAQLVARRRAGREHFLSLNPGPLNSAAAWMNAQQAAWAARLEALDQLLKTENVRATAPAKKERTPR